MRAALRGAGTVAVGDSDRPEVAVLRRVFAEVAVLRPTGAGPAGRRAGSDASCVL